MMGRMLADADIERFVEDGFVAVRGAFSRDLAERTVELLSPGLDPTSDAPVQRLYGSAHPDVVATANTAALTEAFDQLVGPGRWLPKVGVGTFPVRFPSEVDPGDAGWHVDGSFERDGSYWLNHRSDGRALLLLLLYSDVGDDDAPTLIRVGSHRMVAEALEPFGHQGLSFMDLAVRMDLSNLAGDVVRATGRAGDVFLCHPFLVHSASWPHRGTSPRWIAQPALDPGPGFDVSELGCR
jgi:hypothetical protein